MNLSRRKGTCPAAHLPLSAGEPKCETDRSIPLCTRHPDASLRLRARNLNPSISLSQPDRRATSECDPEASALRRETMSLRLRSHDSPDSRAAPSNLSQDARRVQQEAI